MMTTDFFANQDFKFADNNRKASDKTKFAFTVDVEEWFQVGAFESTFQRSEWGGLESRVEIQTEQILKLLSTLGITGTFFSLGWVAERFPELLREIVSAGHELACHGMDHRRLFTMTRQEFSADLIKAKDLLEQCSGSAVNGYRAPSFSLTPDVWWVYDELSKADFKYSSSLYPVKTDHYGAQEAPRVPFLPIGDCNILEIPMTVCDVPFIRLPASGGGYFRLLPYFFSRYLMASGSEQSRSPGIFYMHPWEMDLGQPYIKKAPLLSRFRHYSGQAGLPAKLKRLSKSFSWSSIEDVFGPYLSCQDGSI